MVPGPPRDDGFADFHDSLIVHDSDDPPARKVERLETLYTAHGGREKLKESCAQHLRHEKQNWRPFARNAFERLRSTADGTHFDTYENNLLAEHHIRYGKTGEIATYSSPHYVIENQGYFGSGPVLANARVGRALALAELLGNPDRCGGWSRAPQRRAAVPKAPCAELSAARSWPLFAAA